MAHLRLAALLPLAALASTAAGPEALDAAWADEVSLLQTGIDAGQSRLPAAPAGGSEASLLATGVDAVPQSTPVKFSSVVAEYVAMTLFVVIGCGSAMGVAKMHGAAWILQVSLTFGFAITALAYSIGHYSGGQINCAVTLGVYIAGHLGWAQALCNVAAQLLGSVTGACLLCLMHPKGKDLTGALASNGISEGYTATNALLGEFMMTFLLVFVILETAVTPASEPNRALACLAIGLAVFLAHSVLIPIDGCSINPTRSFGPALVAAGRAGADTFRDMWVFVLGPLAGGAAAAGVHLLFRR